MTSRLTIAIAALTLLAGCRARTHGATPAAPETAHAAESPLPHLSANDGSVAIDNLNAQIASAESRLADRNARLSLVDLLSARGQFLGRIADYERAAEITDGLVKEVPQVADVWLARASTFATFHRFDAALADLAEAEKRGAKPIAVARARASILAAQGHYDEAAKLQPNDGGDVMTLANAAILAGERNQPTAQLFDGARRAYSDVSPFPLAWIDLQEAKLFERRGELAEARRHYVRALSLLPKYAPAAAHLAALSPPEQAVKLLEPLLSTSDDPELLVQLADALRRLGRASESDARVAAARARYDALLQKHPEAFADHAASFFLGVGRDPARALPLAKKNVEVRETVESVELWLTAALAARDGAESCRAARVALALPYPTATLTSTAQGLVRTCPAP